MTTQLRDRNARREGLAEYAHEAWAGWMKYLFSKGYYRNIELDGVVQQVWIMPGWARQRWERQMNTSYADLPEEEKESDRQEADRMLAIMQAYEPPLWYEMGYNEESVEQGDTE